MPRPRRLPTVLTRPARARQSALPDQALGSLSDAAYAPCRPPRSRGVGADRL
jgi:hypothetical protein